LGIADIASVKFGTVPAIFLAHRFVKSPAKIERSAASNEVTEQQFWIVDLASVEFRTKPPVVRPEGFGQLQPNSQLHHKHSSSARNDFSS
jgi:hypothetical protein